MSESDLSTEIHTNVTAPLHATFFNYLGYWSILELFTRFFVNIWITMKFKNVQLWVFFQELGSVLVKTYQNPIPPQKKMEKKLPNSHTL